MHLIERLVLEEAWMRTEMFCPTGKKVLLTDLATFCYRCLCISIGHEIDASCAVVAAEDLLQLIQQMIALLKQVGYDIVLFLSTR